MVDFKKVLTLAAVGTLGTGIVNMVIGSKLVGIASTQEVLGVTVGGFLAAAIAFAIYDYAINK